MTPPEEIVKEAVLITPEALVKLGWSLKGNAWYGNGNKRLTCFDNEWKIWRDAKSIIVRYTFEL